MREQYKTISATEAKNRFGDYLGEVIHGKESVLIEKHGKTVAVLVDFSLWKKNQKKAQSKNRTPWTDGCRKLAIEIKKNRPRKPLYSAVELVNQVRDEESQ